MIPDSFKRMVLALFPAGQAFRRDPDSVVSKVAQAFADELDRVHERGQDIRAESLPGTSDELLSEWETALDLEAGTSTTEQRQLAATQKLTARGGQSPAYFIARALALGYTATITEFGSDFCRVGARVNDRVYGVAYAFAWQLNISPPSGDAVSHSDLESAISTLKPAHTEVIFNYL